jgi:hypothetical protein
LSKKVSILLHVPLLVQIHPHFHSSINSSLNSDNVYPPKRDKQYEVETFEVENLLLAYYPPKDKDEELDNKIRNAIFKMKK